MNCESCGHKVTALRKRYFSSKLRCIWCGHVIDTWEMTLGDYWRDFLIMIGLLHDGNRGRF